jgi:hypothetical protein
MGRQWLASRWLVIDAAINLGLGALLWAYPPRLAAWLGLPTSQSTFFPNILGAVLFGIGLALLIELRRDPSGRAGLGLAGAIAINVCGGIGLGYWLLTGRIKLTPVGTWALGGLAFVLVMLSAAEWLASRTNSARI